MRATRFIPQRSRGTRANLGRRASVVLCAIVPVSVLVASLASPSASADEPNVPYRVIVHPDNPITSASRDFVADAFLKTTTRWEDGETIRVVDQRADAAVRKVFSESVLKRSVSAVRSFWQQRIFSGRDVPPPEVDSDDAVVDYVLGHRGGVGYVSGAAKLREAKVLVVR